MQEEPITKPISPPDLHQIVADDQIIYEGMNWVQAFLDAGRNPAYRDKVIVHLINGEPGARLGPVLVSGWPEQKMHD